VDRDWIFIVILGIGWGSTFFFNEILLREFGPFTVGFIRFSTAAVTCWIYLAVTGQSGLVAPGWLPAFVVMGFLMFALPMTVFPLGQRYVDSSIAGIINALTPVLTVVISHLWVGGERATPLKSLGVLAGFVGIVLITIPALGSGENTRIYGTLIILLAPLGYACGMNWVRRFKGIGMSVITTWALTMATFLSLPMVVLFEGTPGPISGSSWVSILVLGPILTAMGFLAAFNIMHRAGAT
jgi:drug/metabolite transporter (DMT)-like permease